MALQNSAVHRIPPELLGIIFEHCLDDPISSHVIPLLFGRVCKYWRSVSHCTSGLWTTLSLTFHETNVDRSRDGTKVAAAVETWLSRSYPSPLCIAFTDHRIYQKDTEEVVIWLLSRIRMDAPRWKAVHLKLSSDYFAQLHVLSSCAFTSLSAFSVNIDHMGWRSSLLSLRVDLSQATQLTSLAYAGPVHVIKEDILVDWTHLTSIAFSYDIHESGGGGATFPRHFSTLALCLNLTELSIGLSTAHTQPLHPLNGTVYGQMTIELPRLDTLRVRRLSRTSHACALIGALRLPQLSQLYIDSAILIGWSHIHLPVLHPDVDPPSPQGQTQWWHSNHFSALLDRSACQLRTLHIRDVEMCPTELARLLTSSSASSTLSTLVLQPFPRAYPISDVLRYLAPAPAVGPSRVSAPTPHSLSLPYLTKLRLGCAHENHLDMLANIIESRTGDHATQMGASSLLSRGDSLGARHVLMRSSKECYGAPARWG